MREVLYLIVDSKRIFILDTLVNENFNSATGTEFLRVRVKEKDSLV